MGADTLGCAKGCPGTTKSAVSTAVDGRQLCLFQAGMAFDPFKIQKNIRDNSLILQDYLHGLNEWESETKVKDETLAQRSKRKQHDQPKHETQVCISFFLRL